MEMLHLNVRGHCEKCALRNSTVVQGHGPQFPKIAIVGEAPGNYEARIGRPFVGPSGRLIRAVLQQFDIDDTKDVWWTNAVMCRGNATENPKAATIRCCNDRLLKDELPLVQPQKILALGGPALTAVMGSSKILPITRYRGLGMMVDVGGNPTYTIPTYHPAAILRDPDLFRDLVSDMEKLLASSAPLPDLRIEVEVPYTAEEALVLLQDYARATVLSCDLETTGLNFTRDLIISIGFGARDLDGGYHSLILHSLVYRDPRVKAAVRDILLSGRTKIVFQNGKFDLKFLDSYIGEFLVLKNSADTMLWHYALDERPGGSGNEDQRLKTKTHSLKTIARVNYDVEDYTFDWEKFYGGLIEADELFAYQARDCAYTLRLYHDLDKTSDSDSRRLHSDTLVPASEALRAVEERGIFVDRENLRTVRITFTAELERISAEINELANEIAGVPEVNASSPVQIKALIDKLEYDRSVLIGKVQSERTKWSGTDKNSLHKIALSFPEHHPTRVLIQDIMAYRVVKATVGTFVEGIESRLDDDGRLRTSFMLHGTVTGRLSSRNPNLQNLPNYGSGGSGGSGFASAVQSIDVVQLSQSIRNSIIPTPGFTFVEADFSQLELRILAYYCDDTALKQIFIDKEDIHTRVASEIFGKAPEQISAEERRHGKVVDFGIVYGRSAAQIVGGPEMDIVVERGGERWSIGEAQGFLRRFFDGFPGVEPWLRASRQKVHTDHQVVSPMGRVRRLPLVLPDGHAERQAINSPIQSLASDICLHSLVRLVNNLPKDEAFVLLTIHDSILVEVRDDKLDELIPFIKKTMEETKLSLLDTPIPFVVDVKTGKKWGEMKKWRE